MNLTAGDIMQVNVQTVIPEMPLAALERALMAAKVGGFPVVDDGELVGIISRTDILNQLGLARDVAETTSDFYFDESGFHEIAAKSYQEIAERIRERIESLKVKDVMVREIQTVSPDQPLDQVARLFVERRIHRLPVTEHGRLKGIITTMDLARLFADRRIEVAK